MIAQYDISTEHMGMLLAAVSNRNRAHNVFRGTVVAIKVQYRVESDDMELLVEALGALVDLVRSEEHRVDH